MEKAGERAPRQMRAPVELDSLSTAALYMCHPLQADAIAQRRAVYALESASDVESKRIMRNVKTLRICNAILTGGMSLVSRRRADRP